MSANDEPTQTAAIEPTMYWPLAADAPTARRRNANATARPVRMSGVVMMSVCWRFECSEGHGQHRS